MQTWQMQDAKARLSEVIKRAAQDGPQNITVHGKSVAVVLSYETFAALKGTHAAQQSLVDFMQSSPLHHLNEVMLSRDKSTIRETSL